MANRAMPMLCRSMRKEALKACGGSRLKNPHLDEGIKELKEAVEHGKAGHADVATEHAEGAVMHLSEVK